MCTAVKNNDLYRYYCLFGYLFKEADNAEVEGRRKLEEEAAEIQEIGRVSLEAFKETKERNPDKKPKKKQRASGADAIAFIKEKIRRKVHKRRMN